MGGGLKIRNEREDVFHFAEIRNKESKFECLHSEQYYHIKFNFVKILTM